MKYKYILFDLDGTISESGIGIRKSLEATLQDLNIQGVDLSDYTQYIGPPLLDTLKNICKLPPQMWDTGYNIYKDHYANEGRFLNKPYDGIEQVLVTLKSAGYKLAICTSKLEPTAKIVMDDIKLTKYFDAICGSDRECTRKDKKDLIPYAIKVLGGTTQQAVMLGDTWYDAKGAMESGVDFIACSYGYGDNAEMQKYNPVAWVHTPQEILDLLR